MISLNESTRVDATGERATGMINLTSLEKGLRVLQELLASEGGMTVSALAKATGLNRTTTYRLCDVLERTGWIQRLEIERPGDEATRVEAGPRLLGLSVLVTNKYDPEARLRPIIDRLAESESETVHVGILDGTNIVHLARALSSTGLNLAARTGAKEHAHLTALGKALLATLPRERLVELYTTERLPGQSPNSIRSRRELFRDLEATIERGYAIDNEESRIGVKCVAAPVFDSLGRGLFAISVTTAPARLDGARLESVANAIRSAAARATASFGGFIPIPWVEDSPHARKQYLLQSRDVR